MRPSSFSLKPLPYRQSMESHLKRPKDGKDEIGDRDGTLFCLPDDILALLVQQLIDSGFDFRRLLSVGRGFRQLARTVLFRVVKFDGSHEQTFHDGILTFLEKEAFVRLQNRRAKGQTLKPSLGACVRKVVVDITHSPDDATDSTSSDRDEYSRIERTIDIDTFDTIHGPLIYRVISSLPHLDSSELLGVMISQSLLGSLIGSTLRTVELCATIPAFSPFIRGPSWPITNLALNFLAVRDGRFDQNRSLCCESILCLCAPTLQYLTILNRHSSRDNRLWFNLSFPELVFLDISEADIDRSALESLLMTGRKLDHLRIDCTDGWTREVMNTPDELPALRILELHWHQPSMPDDKTVLGFVANYERVTSLAFTEPAPQELSEQILEYLHRLPRLEKLLLVWDRTCSPQRLIEMLSTRDNTSLQQLCLFFVQDEDPSDSFFLNLRRMQPLEDTCRNLKRLVLISCKWAPAVRGRIIRRKANRYKRRFPNLEEIRLNNLTYPYYFKRRRSSTWGEPGQFDTILKK